MKAISEALTDIKKYLEIDKVKDIKVEYGTETNYKRSKSVTLTFKDEEHDFMVTFTKVDNENRWEWLKITKNIKNTLTYL